MLSKFMATALLGLSLNCTSQSNFVPAIIVKANGDSLSGKVDYRNWKRNPEKISFTSASSQTETYSPASLSGFYIIDADERYVSAEVVIDQTTDQYQEAFSTHTSKSSFITKQVFLLQLVNDPGLSLFQYNDGIRTNFFYRQQDQKPAGLTFHFLYVEEGDQVQTNDSYKQQLAVLFAPCAAMANKTRNLSYTEESIKNIVVQYLICANPSHQVEVKKADAMPIKWGVLAGAMYSTFKLVGRGTFHDYDYSTIALHNYSSNVSPIIGVSLDIGLKRNSNRLHFVNELIYKKYKTSDSGFTHTVLYDYSNQVDFEFTYLQLNTLFRYYLSNKNILRPFLNIGIGNAFLVSTQKNNNHLVYDNGTEKNADAVEGPRSYEPVGLLGLGVTASKFVVEARYGFSNGFSPYVRLKSKVNSFHLLVTYQF